MILLTGGTGQVGRSLLALAQAQSLPLVAPTRDALDLADPRSIAAYLARQPWSAIVNAGAYTAVDQAEQDQQQAEAINAGAPGQLAAYCQDHAIPLLHLSTDYVFSGDKPSPYLETDATAPLGVYGQSKCNGETAILATACRAAIVRTAWVVSPYGKNFIKTMMRLAQQREEIQVVADQHGSPTGAPDLAQALLVILTRMLHDPQCPGGLYHATNHGETTWAGLARKVMQVSAQRGGPSARIVEIGTEAYPTAAKRPKNSRLNCDRLQQDWGITLRPWPLMVEDCVTALLNEQGAQS